MCSGAGSLPQRPSRARSGSCQRRCCRRFRAPADGAGPICTGAGAHEVQTPARDLDTRTPPLKHQSRWSRPDDGMEIVPFLPAHTPVANQPSSPVAPSSSPSATFLCLILPLPISASTCKDDTESCAGTARRFSRLPCSTPAMSVLLPKPGRDASAEDSPRPLANRETCCRHPALEMDGLV